MHLFIHDFAIQNLEGVEMNAFMERENGISDGWVGEQGTKSATGSMAEIGVTSPGQDLSAIPVFNADHPFLYVIYESSTHAIFFIGEYAG